MTGQAKNVQGRVARPRSAWIGALLLGACASNPGPPARLGRAEGPPSMECLPSNTPSFSERMRFAWLLTEQSFEEPAPAPPASGTALQIQDWSDARLRPWLRRKSQLVSAAREELDAAAEETQGQRTIAGALVALMYEDVGRALLRVPMPDDLRNEPEIAEAFQDVIDAQARPYLDVARRAYRACALNARGDDELSSWQSFCHGRRGGLPAEHVASGETVVEVIAPE
ncbi:MAG: hypothetical protein AAF645_04900 [Myxococcota bacterium]